MKPSYEELEQKLAVSQREFRAAYATIENLQMQVEKLAAENAGMKNAISAVSKTSEECEINGDELKYVVEPSEFDALTDLLDETPATEAFLAEVRAQGVDSAINTVIAMMNHQHPVTSKAIDILRTHAYQIRKGAQS